MMCFHMAQDGAGRTRACLAAPHFWPNRFGHYQQEVPGCSHMAASGRCLLPANLSSVSMTQGRQAPCQRLKGSVRRRQLKVQISLPHCSPCEWPCLCNTEDVLNGRAQAVNHLIITARVSQPQHIIRPSFGSSSHLRLNHCGTGLSWRRLAWSVSRAKRMCSHRSTCDPGGLPRLAIVAPLYRPWQHTGFLRIGASVGPYTKVRQQIVNHVSYHCFLKNSSRVKGLALSWPRTMSVVSQGPQITE